MGFSSWSEDSYCTYACSTGRSYDHATRTLADTYTSAQEAFKSTTLDESLNPKNVMRECCDSDEHPNSIPVILALDVTGSMGDTAIKIQKLLNPIMQKLYDEVKDVEISIMAIGDCACDYYPIQMSQFESDIRIADNLDKIYFENGGGGNTYESYTAAWYMGSRHTKLDCWKRGKKGIIITMGDEQLNPYLPINHSGGLVNVTGDALQGNVDTNDLYEEAKQKFDLFHICVESKCYPDQTKNAETFRKVMGNEHVAISSVDNITDTIVNAIKYYANREPKIIVEDSKPAQVNENGEISW